MSKLCSYCGAEMDNDAVECPECRKKIPGAEVIQKQRELEKKQKTKSILVIGGIITGIIVFVSFMAVFISKNSGFAGQKYNKPINNYINGCLYNDYKKYMSSFTDYYGVYIAQEYSYYVLGQIPEDPENVQKAAILYLDAYYQDMIAKYGSDVDVSYNILTERQYTESEIEQFQEEYISLYPDGLSETKFTDGYELAVQFDVSGNLGKNTITETNFMVFEIDGEWKIMSRVDFFTEEEEKTSIEDYR